MHNAIFNTNTTKSLKKIKQEQERKKNSLKEEKREKTCAVAGSNFPLLSLNADESPSANIRGWPLTRRVSSVSACPLELRGRSRGLSQDSNCGSKGFEPTVHKTRSACKT